MTKLLLLDLDGTVRRCKSNPQGFINDPKDQELFAGVEDAIAHYYAKGWIAVGISNQGGVAAGHKSLEDAIAEQEYTLELLPAISEIYFCPDFEGRLLYNVSRCGWLNFVGDKGEFRKPAPGMLHFAIATNIGQYFQIEDYLYVGDRAEDEQAAAAAGIRFMWADKWRGGL